MYSVESNSKQGGPGTSTLFKSFRKAKEYYNHFCMFLFSKVETEIEDGTILAWSENEKFRVTFEKMKPC